MTDAVPAAAITAAAEALTRYFHRLPYPEEAAKRALEDAAPHLAAAERERILVPDETLHADGSIGPDSVPAEFRQDAAYWYRRWLFAMKMLDDEAYQRICGWPKAWRDGYGQGRDDEAGNLPLRDYAGLLREDTP